MDAMNMAPRLLATCLLTLAVAVIAWDLYMYFSNRPSDTVSAIVYQWSKFQPIIPFAIGILAGHIFWRN